MDISFIEERIDPFSFRIQERLRNGPTMDYRLMLLQYDRVIRVSVANLTIDNLRISFAYNNVADQQEQDSKITIYNLRESTYRQIYNIRRVPPYNIATVSAGYRQETGLNKVFSGVIAWIERDANEGSITTTLHIGDRVKQFSPTWFERSYNKKTSARSIIKDIAAGMGLVVRNLAVVPDGVGLEGMHFSDPSANAMRSVLEAIKDEVPQLYWVQDKNSIILAKGADPRRDTGILFKSPETGLIGVPKLEEDERLKIDMLLDLRPQLKGLIRFVGSKYVDDTIDYTIDKVTHKGDNWTGDCITRLECIPPGYVPLSSSGRIAVTEAGQKGGSRTGKDSARNPTR